MAKMRRLFALTTATTLGLSLFVACGSRTGLLAPEEEDASPDVKPDHKDAKPEADVIGRNDAEACCDHRRDLVTPELV